MSDIDSDCVYSAEDVFDPKVYAEIVTSLSTPPSNSFPKRSDRRPSLLSLGGNVVRLLLTYFSADDMIRVTGTCKELYRIGAEPALLRTFGFESNMGGQGNIRRAFLEEKRDRVLRTQPAKGIHRETIYDQHITSLFHIESVCSRSVFFSVYDSQLLCWEYAHSTVRITKKYPGVNTVRGFAVFPSKIVLLGDEKVIRLVCDWKNEIYEEFDYKEALLPSSQSGFVKILPKTNQIIVAKGSFVTIFDENLTELRKFAWTILDTYLDSISALLNFPSNSSFLVISASKMVTFNPAPSKKRTKALNFTQILQAAACALEVPAKEYIFLLGHHSGSTKLFANAEVVVESATSFAVSSNKSLVVLISPAVFRVYSLAGPDITETHSWNYEKVGNFLSIVPCSNKVIAVTSQTGDIYSEVQLKPVSVCNSSLHFCKENQYIYSTSLRCIRVANCFAVRNEIVVVGVMYPCLVDCVVVMDYFRDAVKGTEWNVDGAVEQEMKEKARISAETEREMLIKMGKRQMREWQNSGEQERQSERSTRRGWFNGGRIGKKRRRTRRTDD